MEQLPPVFLEISLVFRDTVFLFFMVTPWVRAELPVFPTYVLKERILKSILCCTRNSFLNVYGFFFFFLYPYVFGFLFGILVKIFVGSLRSLHVNINLQHILKYTQCMFCLK